MMAKTRGRIQPTVTSRSERPMTILDDNESMIVISDIEEIFLMGQYSSALTLCNRYLKTSTELQSKKERERIKSSHTIVSCDSNELLLNIPLRFKFDMTNETRYVSIHSLSSNCHNGIGSTGDNDDYDDDSVTISKVGAMALQSWYELLKKQRQLEEASGEDGYGYRFIQPFLNTFTTTSSSSVNSHSRCMGLDLFIIFIRFLSSSIVGQEVEAISLVVEFLHHLRTGTILPSPDVEFNIADRTSGQEILVYFFTEILPQKCCSVTYGDMLLEYIKDGSCNVTIACLPTTVSSMLNESLTLQGTNKEMIQLCLKYCNTDDGNWPKNEWINDAFCQCRKVLQRELNVMYYNKQLLPLRVDKEDATVRLQNETVNIIAEKHSKWKNSPRFPLQLLRTCQNLLLMLTEKLHSVATTRREEENIPSSSPQESLRNSIQRRDGIRILCVMTIMVMISIYRYRHGMSKMVRTAVWMAIWKPLQEIVQAIRNE